MGYRHRHMYYLTGLPGWIRFGFSPGWLGRSPTGLPPTAQWLLQSGLISQYLGQIQVPKTGQTPTAPSTSIPMPFGAPFAPGYSREQERVILEQQMEILEAQLDAIRKRLDELSKEGTGK
jgi:hypothetical protein